MASKKIVGKVRAGREPGGDETGTLTGRVRSAQHQTERPLSLSRLIIKDNDDKSFKLAPGLRSTEPVNNPQCC